MTELEKKENLCECADKWNKFKKGNRLLLRMNGSKTFNFRCRYTDKPWVKFTVDGDVEIPVAQTLAVIGGVIAVFAFIKGCRKIACALKRIF